LPLSGKGIITRGQKDVLKAFSTLGDAGHFYLTGGTALAEFYLGHRRSFDLDLFTAEKALVLPFSRLFEEEMKEMFDVRVVRRFETFVEFEVGQSDEAIKVDLAYDSPFRFEEPIASELGVRVNDLKDLVVEKLLAFFGRAEPRDAIDLFFILKDWQFDEIVRLALRKDPGFDLYWLAIALEKATEFPDTIKEWPVEMLVTVNVTDLKNLFSSLARVIMQGIKSGHHGD
jgi:hypothetical protein